MSLLLLLHGSASVTSGSGTPTIGVTATLAAAGVGAVTPAIDYTSDQARRPAVVWVHNLSGTRVAAIHDLLDLEVEYRLQDQEALRLEIPADSTKARYLLADAELHYDYNVWRVSTLEQRGDGAKATIYAEAEPLWQVELGGRKMVGDFALKAVTVSSGLTSILSGSGWTVGEIPTDVTTHSISATDATLLELVRQWAKATGYEVVFNTEGRGVTFATTQGTARGTGFRYGRNIQGIVRRVERPRVTRLYAYGRQGINITAFNASKAYVEDYSWYTGQGILLATAQASYRRDEVWTDESFVDAQSLYTAAVLRLAQKSQGIISYDCKVSDLSAITGLEDDTYRIGDTVQVRDSRFTVDVSTRVVRLVKRQLEPWRSEIELAYLWKAEDNSDGSRSPSSFSSSWALFRNENTVARTINSHTAILNELDLEFAEGGEGVFGAHVLGSATGSGTITFTVYDENAAAAFMHTESIAFTNGQQIVWSLPFARQSLSGSYFFTTRAQITSGTGTVAVAVGDGRLYVLAQGATNATKPLPPTSLVVEYDGDDLSSSVGSNPFTWTVPAGVLLANFDLYGGSGTGGGGRTRARIVTTPGETFTIYLGSKGFSSSVGTGGGYNGGGGVGIPPFGGAVDGGGGGSDVRRGGTALSNRILVAGGGGGAGGSGLGGAGGGATGGAGTGVDFGSGGSQSAGGASPANGGAGSLGQGGKGDHGANSGGGGGGGGYYGGGGGYDYGGGGGGSSYYPSDADLVYLEAGTWLTHGYLIITWTTPESV